MTQKLTPLDMAVTDEKLQTLKLMLPYVPLEVQPFLGIYVKFAEFQNTVSYFQQFPDRYFGKCSNQNVSVESIVEDLKEYFAPFTLPFTLIVFFCPFLRIIFFTAHFAFAETCISAEHIPDKTTAPARRTAVTFLVLLVNIFISPFFLLN